MRQSYLEVTFRHGRPLAAYYYLVREPGDRVHHSERTEHGIVIDFAADGRPLGLELTAPAAITVEAVNEVLNRLGQPPVAADDLAPLAAA